jgi:hypothetical protein
VNTEINYLPAGTESAQLLAPAALNPAQPTPSYPIKTIHMQDNAQQLTFHKHRPETNAY